MVSCTWLVDVNPVNRAVPDGITTLVGVMMTGTWVGRGTGRGRGGGVTTAGTVVIGREAEIAVDVGMSSVISGSSGGGSREGGAKGMAALFVGDGNKSTFSPSSSHPLSPSTGFSGERERRERESVSTGAFEEVSSKVKGSSKAL